MGNVDLVKHFLRGQNLEQIGRVDDAMELYENAVERGFDSAGPYDRLISLYSDRARHADVVRIAEAALVHVHTYQDKKSWYEIMRAEALEAQSRVPRAARKKEAGPTQ